MQQGTTQSQQPVTAAGMAVHRATLRFPGEDGGRSLADMAQRDLDAALQLLADRALYITGSTGAAIALRRMGKNDMQCRASTGTSAPELGALLSTEIGLSGESVRTRRALRCDDAERDARVNREVCREMGIASVVVMPVVNDDQVLGVFELFSGKTNAFGERDLTALQRLSEMVETAVKLAHAAETVPVVLATAAPSPATEDAEKRQTSTSLETRIEGTPVPSVKAWPAAPQADAVATQAAAPVAKAQPVALAKPEPAPLSQSIPIAPAPAAVPKKPVFWSAAKATPEALSPAQTAQVADQSHVPPVLRNLRKCEACGFPVSAGRALCVECEEKKWRGQLRRNAPLPTANSPAIPSPVLRTGAATPESSTPVARLMAAAGKSGAATAAAPAPVLAQASATVLAPAVAQGTLQGTFIADIPTPAIKNAPNETRPDLVTPSLAGPAAKSADMRASHPVSRTARPELVLSAAIDPPQSWFAANKYIISALVLVAATVAAIMLLH